MKQFIGSRIEKLQRNLVELNLDAAMIYDRENLIYFTGAVDLEGGALAVPAKGEPELFCLWPDADHMREASGIKKVTPYRFPHNNPSIMMANWLKEQEWEQPKLGFTRYFISLKDFQCLRNVAPNLYVGDIAQICYQLRSVKCETEIERIKKAASTLKYGMAAAIECIRPGILETDVIAEAEYAMLKAGSQGSAFRMQVLTRHRQQLIHPYAGPYSIEDNAPVVIHLGASYEGYTAKMCRTIFLGSPDNESIHIYKTLQRAQETALNLIKPGITCGEIYDVVTDAVNLSGYGKEWIMEHIGYGVGIRQSEFYPIIAEGSQTVIEKDMVIDLLLPTIFKPLVGGPRVTDTILVEAKKNLVLTDYFKELIIK